MQHGHAESRWPRDQTSKPEVNSRDVIKWMRSISASISVTITDIWTNFGTEHKYHTINTPEWPNSHNLTIQDGGCRHLEFRKKMSITPDWIKISAPNFMGRCITAMQRWPRDQKLKPEVNSRDVIKWMRSISASISVTITYIWTKFGTEHNTILSTRRNNQIHITWKSYNLHGGRRHLGFLGYVKRKMSIIPDWIKISASNFTG